MIFREMLSIWRRAPIAMVALIGLTAAEYGLLWLTLEYRGWEARPYVRDLSVCWTDSDCEGTGE